MSDYSSAMLDIANIPDGSVIAVYDALQERDVQPDEITAGEDIYLEDQRLDIVSELGSALMDQGVTFNLFQDAKYEYDGEGVIHVPGVGSWFYSGGGSGEPMINAAAIDALLEGYDTATLDIRAVIAELRALTGSEVRHRWNEIMKGMGEPKVWAAPTPEEREFAEAILPGRYVRWDTEDGDTVWLVESIDDDPGIAWLRDGERVVPVAVARLTVAAAPLPAAATGAV